MKVKIKYPIRKCALCGKEFEKKHNRQIYCSDECRTEAKRRQDTKARLRYWHKNKTRLNKTRPGTICISQHRNPDTDKEQKIVQNEKQRLGLTLF